MMLRLSLALMPGSFAVCRLDPDDPVPAWASPGQFISTTRTPDELSIVCPEHLVPDGVRCERGWRCLRVAGPLDFTMTGVVASLALPLAEAGISTFIVSTFDTDYVFVKETTVAKTRAALQAAGHDVPEGGASSEGWQRPDENV